MFEFVMSAAWNIEFVTVGSTHIRVLQVHADLLCMMLCKIPSLLCTA